MEFHAIQGDKVTHVLTTHRGEADETPLQLVSAARVAYWQRLEAAQVAREGAAGAFPAPVLEQSPES